jgi:OOP family OmpA-OmpF porin
MIKPVHVTAAVFVALLSLGACKRKEAPPAEATPTPPAASTASPTPAGAPASPADNTAATSPVKPFDLQSVPVSSATLPPFPYVDKPAGMDGYHDTEQQFDRIYVIAGSELRPVEGHYRERWFPLGVAKMSQLEAFRNYDNAFRALGAVRVDAVHPADPAFVARNGDKETILKRLHLPNLPSELSEGVPVYAQYLLRTADRNIWLSFSIFDSGNNVNLMVMEEKPMQQSVAFIQADEMANALGKDGHIALYLNFDTDSDAIRPDSKPVVEEIAKLLRTDPQLKLKVEGHTDNSGQAARNRELSRQRAESVVRAVTGLGIDSARLQAAGVGADKPLADNGTEEGRARNRRVELVKA